MIQETQLKYEKEANSFMEHLADISSIEKKYDRRNSEIVKKMTGEFTDTKENEVETETPPETHPPERRASHSEIAGYQFLLENRTREHEEVSKENQALKWKVEDLYSQFEALSPDYLRSRSDYLFELQSSLEFFKSSFAYYEEKQAKLIKLESVMKEERRQLVDEHKEETTSRKAIIMTEQTRIQDNLNRIKTQCDELKKKLDGFMAKENERKAHNEALSYALTEHKVTHT